jgi:hypothetical protein
MSVSAKLYNKLLLERLRDKLDAKLRYNQNGFRSLRSTAQHVLSLRRLFEEVKDSSTAKLVSIFIDFSKAFDSIDWNYIENILLSYGVPNELVEAIMSIYYGAKAAVKANGNISDSFDLGVGVLQGDTLAPYLFVIVLDWVMRNAIDDSLGFPIIEPSKTKTRIIKPGLYLADLDFADDIALLSNNIDKAQKLLLSVEKWALKVGLKINVDKTVYLLVGNWDKSLTINLQLSSGVKLQAVNDFKYLGSWLLNSTNDFKIRKGAAWSACKQLNRIWRSDYLDDKLKLNLFKALVESILLYNATTWTITKTLAKQLDGTYNKMLRYALNIVYKAGERLMTNEEIYSKHKIIPISRALQARRLKFAGHCHRSIQSAYQPIQYLLLWDIKGSKKRGRRSNYRKILLQETGYVEEDNELGYEKLKKNMDNRKGWSKFVSQILKG